MTDQILLFLAELLKVEDCEASTEIILDQPHDTDDDLLLDTILCSMWESTLCYEKEINSERKDKKNQLVQTQLNKLISSINAEELFAETTKLEGELLRINEDFLADQAAIFKNIASLNDCKPTAKFLNMKNERAVTLTWLILGSNKQMNLPNLMVKRKL